MQQLDERAFPSPVLLLTQLDVELAAPHAVPCDGLARQLHDLAV